jgi:hypothetical protein
MTTVKFDNCGILTKMGDSSTHIGSLIPPVDGVDFPHTGLIKLFDAQRYGYAILNNSVTTNSTTATPPTDFDRNFNISMSDTGSKSNLAVMEGAVIRDGILVTVETGQVAGVGKAITEILSGSPSDVEFIEQGSSGENFYHVIVVNSANTVKIRNPSAKDKVADLLAGDIPIAILRVQNGENKLNRQIQYLGTDRRDGGLSIYYDNSNVPTESVRISASAGDTTIENKVDDKDIIFKVSDGGTPTEVMRIDGDVARVGIGLDDPAGKLHVKTTDVDYAALFETTDDSASAAPDVALYRNSATPANGDDLGHLIWRGVETNGVTLTRGNYADIFCEAQVVTTGSESGKMHLRTKLAGTMNKRISIAATETIINEDSVDANFRVESDGNANMLFVDAGDDEVGIGTNTPVATLDIASGSTFRNTRLLTVSSSTSPLALTEASHAGRYIIYTGSSGQLNLPSTSTAGEHYAILNATSGDITIGRNGNNINGASSNVTLGTYKAATCIAIGSNNWMVIGV